jgi:hypothetical protein
MGCVLRVRRPSSRQPGSRWSGGFNASGSVYADAAETPVSLGNVGLKAPIVAMALENDQASYWLVAG